MLTEYRPNTEQISKPFCSQDLQDKLYFFYVKALFALEALKSGIRWPEFATASAMLFLINTITKGMVTGAHISTFHYLVAGVHAFFFFFS